MMAVEVGTAPIIVIKIHDPAGESDRKPHAPHPAAARHAVLLVATIQLWLRAR